MIYLKKASLETRWLLAILLSTLLLFTGCSDDDDDNTANGESNGTDNGGDSNGDSNGGGSAFNEPLYLVQSAIETPGNDRTVYLNVLKDLTDDIDEAKAVELGSASRALSAFGYIYTFNTESLVISKLSVDDDLSIEILSDDFTLQSLGVNFYGNAHGFVSETRAYYADDGSAQFVVWNPESMEIVTSFSYGDKLPANAEAGVPKLSADGKHLYFPFLVIDYTTFQTDPGARVAIIDTETDSLVDVLHDTRCPGGHGGDIDPTTGDYIFEGGALGGALHYFAGEVEPCFLRIKPGETAFDADWILAGSEINADGHVVVSGTTIIGDQFVTQARDDNEAPVTDILSNPFAYFGEGSYWRYYVGSTSDWSGTSIAGPGDSTASSTTREIDGSFVVSPFSLEDRSAGAAAVIYRLNDQNEWEYLTETIGFVQVIERVR